MTVKPSPILAIRHPATSDGSTFTREWWRWFDTIQGMSGQLENPLVINATPILASATITNGGTVSLANIPAHTLLGNSLDIAAPTDTVLVDSSLSFGDGTLAAASIGPLSLSGNPETISAPPTTITIGTNLELNGSTLNATGDTDDQTLLFTIRDPRIQLAQLTRKVEDALALAWLLKSSSTTSVSSSASGAIYAPTVNGDLPGPTPIADPHGQFVMTQIR
jgi:hypothetical protein